MRKDLDNAIHEFMVRYGKNPKVIFMHPDTWDDIFKEASFVHKTIHCEGNSIMAYAGIQVMRSNDAPLRYFAIC